MTSPNDRESNFLPNHAVESFWDALSLELWPFLCSSEGSRGINAWGDPILVPCFRHSSALLRGARLGSPSGIDSPSTGAWGLGVIWVSAAAFVDDFTLNFNTSYSGWRSWGDLFVNFPPPPLFHCDKTRGGQ